MSQSPQQPFMPAGFGTYTWTSWITQPPPPADSASDSGRRASVETRPTPKLALNVREAAALLGVSHRTIRRLIARGLIRPSGALRHVLIPYWEVERFLRETSAPD